MNILKPFSCLIIVLVIVSCHEATRPSESEKNIFETLFIPDTSGFFRGHYMSDSPNDVLAKEIGQIVVNTDSLLTYELLIALASDTLNTRLYYAFDSFGLFEIQADLYASTEGWMKPYLAQIDSGLTLAYGQGKTVGKTRTWTTVSSSNNIIEITLASEVDDNNIPFLSLNLLEPLDEAL